MRVVTDKPTILTLLSSVEGRRVWRRRGFVPLDSLPDPLLEPLPDQRLPFAAAFSDPEFVESLADARACGSTDIRLCPSAGPAPAQPGQSQHAEAASPLAQSPLVLPADIARDAGEIVAAPTANPSRRGAGVSRRFGPLSGFPVTVHTLTEGDRLVRLRRTGLRREA
jgi:hypothetical protein